MEITSHFGGSLNLTEIVMFKVWRDMRHKFADCNPRRPEAAEEIERR